MDQSPLRPVPPHQDPTGPAAPPVVPAAYTSAPVPQPAQLPLPHRQQVLFAPASTTVHVIHGVLTLLSLGAWAPVWLTYAIAARKRWAQLVIGTDGNTHVQIG